MKVVVVVVVVCSTDLVLTPSDGISFLSSVKHKKKVGLSHCPSSFSPHYMYPIKLSEPHLCLLIDKTNVKCFHPFPSGSSELQRDFMQTESIDQSNAQDRTFSLSGLFA